MVLENPEFPDDTRPANLSKQLKEKYAVGDVIVHPRIVYADGAMTTQETFVVFFSKADTSEVSIKSLTLFVGGEELEYGQRMAESKPSPWEMYPVNDPFYVCSISGEPIDRPKVKMLEVRVDVSLVVSVKDESGKVTEKQIDVYFLPKKRSYLE
jgi:hypothetical protein